MKSWQFSLATASAILWGAAVLATSDVQRAPPPAVARVNYEQQVRPILVQNCLDCHSQDKRKGGLSLATYGDILDGGKDGPIVRPGKSADSLLLHRLTGEIGPQMPRDGGALTDVEITLIRLWIDQGARSSPASAPAPTPWEAPLALTAPPVPSLVWARWTSPADRFVATYLSANRVVEPQLVSDALFARRAYLDIWGLLPTPDQLETFAADRSPSKRSTLVTTLLSAGDLYADHWISFWNDLLRNDDGTDYYSETNGRKSITPWLLSSLKSNLPYDQFVSALLNPGAKGGPDGFLIGVNWRGETSAAMTPWMQASQNTAQLFLGINLKCNSCHDSFINTWKLKDAYGLASFFAPDGRLQLYRCEVAQDQYAEPQFLYPALNRAPASGALADRRAAIAAIFTDPRNGRLPRTLVNRVWQRLLGHGIVSNADEMDGRPWSPALLDWLASDFAAHSYDVKHLIATIMSTRAYQMPAVSRMADAPARDYLFTGPEVRRMTAEQFADAIGSITGEWAVSDGAYVREWRSASTNLTRALGRPIRDQVTSVRATQPTTPQALELVNGDTLTRRLQLGARRMVGTLGTGTTSLINRPVAGRLARPATFDIDVSKASRLWLVIQENGSNVPAQILPVWAQAELVGPNGTTTLLSSMSPEDRSGLRPGTGPVSVNGTPSVVVRAKNPSTLVYDIAGRGFTRFRGSMWLENPVNEIGATLDPQLWFFVFDAEPDPARLIPPSAGAPMTPGPVLISAVQAADRVLTYALGRRPTAAERQLAENAVQDPARPGHPSADGLADLLWALFMKPEFQFIY